MLRNSRYLPLPGPPLMKIILFSCSFWPSFYGENNGKMKHYVQLNEKYFFFGKNACQINLLSKKAFSQFNVPTNGIHDPDLPHHRCIRWKWCP